MPNEKREGSKSKADYFERWLLEAPESDFQEFFDEALKSLSDLSLELLRECKARVDARLAAEPETRVFYMSDPHQIRVRNWYQIADRLQAEISYRSHQSVARTSMDAFRNPARPGAEKEPSVAARRTIVRQNAGISDKELCQLLDREGVRLPKRWPEAGFKTWVGAWGARQRQIHVIFSKDRRSI